jgi:predicted RecA/RadA family phage recombinase
MEATYVRPRHETRLTLAAAIVTGEVYQLNDGRAAVFSAADGLDAGERASLKTDGTYTVVKTASQVWVKGDPIWWDRSAGSATCLEPIGAGDRDFYLGVATEDAASADTTGSVNLNVEPTWIIDSTRDNGDTVVVLTAGTPNLFNRGGMMTAFFSATAEAQKLDWLSDRSFPLASNWVLEALVEIATNADADVADLSIFVANATHASDADAITESAGFHFDLGADLNIDAESDDGTTEVAATDTTVDFAVGTPVRLKLDGRDPSNVKYYIDGVEVLSGTANLGNIAVATGPLKALFHLEKSSNDSPGEVKCRIRVRTAEQD